MQILTYELSREKDDYFKYHFENPGMISNEVFKFTFAVLTDVINNASSFNLVLLHKLKNLDLDSRNYSVDNLLNSINDERSIKMHKTIRRYIFKFLMANSLAIMILGLFYNIADFCRVRIEKYFDKKLPKLILYLKSIRSKNDSIQKVGALQLIEY